MIWYNLLHVSNYSRAVKSMSCKWIFFRYNFETWLYEHYTMHDMKLPTHTNIIQNIIVTPAPHPPPQSLFTYHRVYIECDCFSFLNACLNCDFKFNCTICLFSGCDMFVRWNKTTYTVTCLSLNLNPNSHPSIAQEQMLYISFCYQSHCLGKPNWEGHARLSKHVPERDNIKWFTAFFSETRKINSRHTSVSKQHEQENPRSFLISCTKWNTVSAW